MIRLCAIAAVLALPAGAAHAWGPSPPLAHPAGVQSPGSGPPPVGERAVTPSEPPPASGAAPAPLSTPAPPLRSATVSAPLPVLAPAAPPPPPPPPAAAAPVAATPPAATPPAAPPQTMREPLAPLPVDDVRNPGYLPGYRAYQGLSLSPFAPRVGALPGGLTPGTGARMPPSQWTFRWNGFLSASLQSSFADRRAPLEGQGGTVFHIPPQTVDEYASFIGTSTVPGQWVALTMSYGTPVVSANLAFNTWNPSAPSTYYQIGSQYFINAAYLQFDLPAFGALKLRASTGYLYNHYGVPAQYGTGMYTNFLSGSARGVGETATAEYTLGPSLALLFEQGIIGNRSGKVPDGIVPTGNSGNANPTLPSSWVLHGHVGLVRRGEPLLKAQVHYMVNLAFDDRSQRLVDNPATRELNEAHIRDGRIDVVGVDVAVHSRTWGYLGAAASVTKGDNAFPLRGLQTFGGEGDSLTRRWWGGATSGTGTLLATALNYSASLGRIINAPLPFTADRPDLIVNAGVVIAYASTSAQSLSGTTSPGALPAEADLFNHRLRYKFGVDALYTLTRFMGAGARVDRVVPSSKDADETFHVLATRLVFRTGWQSREAITLLYAKWFYGSHSHPETSALIPGDVGLDDQLLALNVNIWW